MILESMDATASASKNPDIMKRTDVSGLILSLLLICLGVGAFLPIKGFADHSSVLAIALMVAGSILIMLGLFRLFWKTTKTVYVPTGSATRERSVFFDLKHIDDLKQCVSTGVFPLDSSMKSEDNGNIRMDVIMSQDKKFAAVQLFQFVPYAYNPVTPVYYFTNGEAAGLASFLTKSNYKASR